MGNIEIFIVIDVPYLGNDTNENVASIFIFDADPNNNANDEGMETINVNHGADQK